MYGKLIDGKLHTPSDDICNSINKMLDAGYKPILENKPIYNIQTQYANIIQYVDTGRFIKPIYEIVEIQPTEEELIITQTDKALSLLNINLTDMLPNLTDEQALQVPYAFPKWQQDKDYAVGDRVLYLDILYKVLQAHTSQETWEPDITPSLFTKVLIPDPNVVPEWQQPDSTNPYMLGDKVMYQGKIYISLIDNNVWSPVDYAAGWKELEGD